LQEVFTRATAFEYSWANSIGTSAGNVDVAVEADVNDRDLDVLMSPAFRATETSSTAGSGSVCSIVQLSRQELVQQVCGEFQKEVCQRHLCLGSLFLSKHIVVTAHPLCLLSWGLVLADDVASSPSLFKNLCYVIAGAADT
jgi:hypothetical protein